MANKNRTEVSGIIQAQTAIVGETEYKSLLDDNFAQSVVFRKDVEESDTASAGSKTIDFLDKDYISITQTGNVVYTLNNVQQGEIKFLKITKSATNTITFTGASLEEENIAYITSLTSVLFQIFNKGGSVFVKAITKTIPSASETNKGIAEIATDTETKAGTDDTRIITPKKLSDNVLLKDNTTTYVPSGDYNPATKIFVEKGGEIARGACTKVFSGLTTESYCIAYGRWNVIYLTYKIAYNSLPSENTILFTLPSRFPLFNIEDDFFCMAVGTSGNIQLMKTDSGTRNLVAGQFSSGSTTAYGSVAIPIEDD